MDHYSSKPGPIVPLEEAILKAKVAQIADSIGYNAITQDSSNILVDLYRRTIHHLARHCKDAANNNRRIDSTITDLVQAFNFIGINITELKEHIETIKIPLNFELTQSEDQKPSNRIQRELLVDDLLEAEKKGQQGDQEDGDKAVSDSGIEEDDKPVVPLLKDTYAEIASKFNNCQPVIADKKIRLGGRIVLVASTKLKINTPIPPEPAAPSSSSFFPISEDKTEELAPEVGETKKSRKKQTEKKLQAKSAEGKRKKRSAGNQLANETKKVKAEKEKPSTQEKAKRGRGRKKLKTEVTPLDPSIAEPPSFLQILETKPEEEKVPEIEEPKTSRQPTPSLPAKQNKGKKKKRSSDEFAIVTETVTPKKATEEKTKVRGRKKLKTPITPLDPSIAEPPSFFPILEAKPEELAPEVEEPKTSRQSTPSVPAKQTKGKKRKKSSSNQFAIVTETVTATAVASDDKEWLCPACGGPDDGDLMVECDSCKEWYHLGCTSLSKPPEDDENWECDICINCAKAAATQKRSQTPVEPAKLKTPEPVFVKTTTPPAPSVAPPTAVAGSSTSQDDLCPECNLPDDGTMMIQCDDPFCAKWFHGKCVNLLEEPKEDESWFCKACVEKQQSAFKRRRRAK